jgi:hypothetical protein
MTTRGRCTGYDPDGPRDFAVANACHSEECSDEESALRYVVENRCFAGVYPEPAEGLSMTDKNFVVSGRSVAQDDIKGYAQPVFINSRKIEFLED